MSHMIDHPLRQSSANELHARPFRPLQRQPGRPFLLINPRMMRLAVMKWRIVLICAACWICMTWRIPMMMQPIFLAN